MMILRQLSRPMAAADQDHGDGVHAVRKGTAALAAPVLSNLAQSVG
jgi:hypothetical protein